MKKTFLGKGIGFPVRLDAKGNVALTEFEQNIEEAIQIIIGTAPGERIMRPEFGCRIHDFVFYPNNSATASLVSFYVREALQKWEPRVDSIEVAAYPDVEMENVMRIDVNYRIRRTNSPRNLVYPFFLRREQET